MVPHHRFESRTTVVLRKDVANLLLRAETEANDSKQFCGIAPQDLLDVCVTNDLIHCVVRGFCGGEQVAPMEDFSLPRRLMPGPILRANAVERGLCPVMPESLWIWGEIRTCQQAQATDLNLESERSVQDRRARCSSSAGLALPRRRGRRSWW